VNHLGPWVLKGCEFIDWGVVPLCVVGVVVGFVVGVVFLWCL